MKQVCAFSLDFSGHCRDWRVFLKNWKVHTPCAQWHRAYCLLTNTFMCYFFCRCMIDRSESKEDQYLKSLLGSRKAVMGVKAMWGFKSQCQFPGPIHSNDQCLRLQKYITLDMAHFSHILFSLFGQDYTSHIDKFWPAICSERCIKDSTVPINNKYPLPGRHISSSHCPHPLRYCIKRRKEGEKILLSWKPFLPLFALAL